MSYIDDFVAANAGSMTRDQLVTSLRGAGYSDGDIKAALRRGGTGTSPTNSPGSTPSAPTAPMGVGPNLGRLPGHVSVGPARVPMGILLIGIVVAVIVIAGVASGALRLDVYLLVIPIVAYRLWTFFRGDAPKPSPSQSQPTPLATISQTGGNPSTAVSGQSRWTRRGIVRMMVILVVSGVVILTFFTLLVLGATTPSSPTTAEESWQAALELVAMVGIVIGATVLIGIGFLASRLSRASE